MAASTDSETLLTPVAPASACSGELRDIFSPHASELLRSCIHCGLCLGACPTYRENGNENDSPRGRLYLMKGLADGRLEPTPDVTQHLDLCLDCRACETACPSGVHYGSILESTRESIEKTRTPGAGESFLRWLFFKELFPHHNRLALVTKVLRFVQKSGLRSAAHSLGLVHMLPKRLRDLEAQQPDLSEKPFREHAPAVFPAWGGEPKMRVAFFTGCVMDLFMGGIHRATVRTLQAHGCEVLTVHGQACCGALAFHAGDGEAGRSLARRNVTLFEGLDVDAIVNNSAGCGAALKEYGELLPGEPRAEAFSKLNRDVSEVLAGLEPLVELKPIEKTICYDEPCHLLHGQKISAPPKKVMQRIPGLKWVTLPDAEFCCGAAGIYNLTQPKMAGKVLARKIDAIKSTGAEIVVTGNPGCLLQIRQGCKQAGLSCEVLHPMELFARALPNEVI